MLCITYCDTIHYKTGKMTVTKSPFLGTFLLLYLRVLSHWAVHLPGPGTVEKGGFWHCKLACARAQTGNVTMQVLVECLLDIWADNITENQLDKDTWENLRLSSWLWISKDYWAMSDNKKRVQYMEVLHALRKLCSIAELSGYISVLGPGQPGAVSAGLRQGWGGPFFRTVQGHVA